MNQHLATAVKLYESNDTNIQELIGWHFCHGIVVCNPKAFALGFHVCSKDLETPVLFEESDTLFVTMCCGDMVEALNTFHSAGISKDQANTAC
jgi:hypothetical protein